MSKQTAGRHRADLISLFFGVLFLAVAGWWAASYFLDVTWVLDWDLPHLGWFAAGALILLGLVGILSSLRRDTPKPVDTTATTAATAAAPTPVDDPALEGDRPPGASAP